MKIIRCKEQDGENPCVAMIPLLVQWGIRRCNIAGCKNKPTTIVSGIYRAPIFGLCELHYQDFSKEDKPVKFSLEFD